MQQYCNKIKSSIFEIPIERFVHVFYDSFFSILSVILSLKTQCFFSWFRYLHVV